MTILTFATPCAAPHRRPLPSLSRPLSAFSRPHLGSRRARVSVITCVETPTNKAEQPIEAPAKPPAQAPAKAVAAPHLPDLETVKEHADAHSARGSISADIAATAAWVAVAAVVAGGIIATNGWQSGIEFVTAYIVEYSLSVDNLFVFLLIFSYFRVEAQAQLRVLTYGVAGAMVMRGALIFVGEALTQRFQAVTVGFALLLLYSSSKLLLGGGEDEDDLEHNRIVKFSRRLLPFSDKYDGDRFFTMENGVRLATPLMLVLLSVEFSDVVFALDSVPAVLGISTNTLVIYLSNILAIMGLRSLFFVLSDAIGDLRFLQQSLGLVLGFVGAKMIAGVGGFEVGVVQSLAVVVGTLAGGVGLSVAFPGEEEQSVGGKTE